LNAEQDGVLQDGTVDDNFGEIKYRFRTEAATDDGDLKGRGRVPGLPGHQPTRESDGKGGQSRLMSFRLAE